MHIFVSLRQRAQSAPAMERMHFSFCTKHASQALVLETHRFGLFAEESVMTVGASVLIVACRKTGVSSQRVGAGDFEPLSRKLPRQLRADFRAMSRFHPIAQARMRESELTLQEIVS